jgi:NADH:quinone reductase (non-electrogenic)
LRSPFGVRAGDYEPQTKRRGVPGFQPVPACAAAACIKSPIDQESRPETSSNSARTIETVFYDVEGHETVDASRAVRAHAYAAAAGGLRVRRLPGLEWQVDHSALAGDEGELATRPIDFSHRSFKKRGRRKRQRDGVSSDRGRGHRVVVIGGGFGGLNVVRSLRRAPVEVTLVDRQNFHLFQPLAYQVATGSLAAPEIAAPLRVVFRRQANVRVLLAEVTGFDLERRQVVLDRYAGSPGRVALDYDTLVVAGGSHYSYFGHDEWQPYAPELKSLDGALDIRSRILSAFEAAELEDDDQRQQDWLTFVIVGGGPTGVEMAGQIAELAHDALRRDFRRANTASARVLLVETTGRVLPAFPSKLSTKAAQALQQLGVTPLIGHTVIDVGPDSVTIRNPEGTTEQIGARTVVWAAGVAASELAGLLAREVDVELDRTGRIPVGPDLTLPSHPEVFALGDMARLQPADLDAPLPGLAPVAIQEGRYVARTIRQRLKEQPVGPFHYRDKGNLATIGRSRAVCDLKVIKVSGFLAWALWLGVHLFYLIGFQNRLLVMLRWTFSFLTHGRGARLINPRSAPTPDHVAQATATDQKKDAA